MEIVRLTAATEETVRELNALLAQMNKDGDARQGTLADLQEIVADPTAQMFVIRDQEKIIGMATLYSLTQLGKRSGYVEDVVVDSAYRGQGLGAQIMEALIAHARDAGMDALHLTSRPAREAANKLYQKLGFEQRETNAYRLKLK